MKPVFARRMAGLQRSFIREILKVTESSEVISFAGGLPNPRFFPVEEMAEACSKVLRDNGRQALQYRTTEGFRPLREKIVERYSERGLRLTPDNVLITTGSQQGIDLIGKIFLDEGDRVVLERPSYLGAIQALGLYQPAFCAVPLEEDGPSIESLSTQAGNGFRLMYSVANFQNPSGLTYSQSKREKVAEAISRCGAVFVEDDPYGELRFRGEPELSMRHFLGDQAVLLGSFSKIVSPGLRLGWIVSSPAIMEKLVIAKQASDLHSSSFEQRLVHRFLLDQNLDQHLDRIRAAYGAQRDVMIRMIEAHCPPEIRFTRPEGGMFLWVTLPEGLSSMDLFDRAVRENVAFVPGHPFYIDGGGDQTLRLNFSNTDPGRIEEGIQRLGKAMKQLTAGPPLPRPTLPPPGERGR
jgi:2-aminoadipate transaminase